MSDEKKTSENTGSDAPSDVASKVSAPVVEDTSVAETHVSKEAESQESTPIVRDEVVQELPKSKYDEVRPGAFVRVYQKVKEMTSKGTERERVQYFEGTVIARKHGKGVGSTITVRKVSDGVGVEKIFPLHLPTLTKIELIRKFKTRRSKLYFLRNYKKRLHEVKQ